MTQRKAAPAGFSLVELLLTLVLIVALLGASVLYFTAAFARSGLDEGAERFVTLIRFAQAEAANSGRKVRLSFELPGDSPLKSAEGGADTAGLRRIHVSWEIDALNQPGQFEEITRRAWVDPGLNELVGVLGERPLDEGWVDAAIGGEPGEGVDAGPHWDETAEAAALDADALFAELDHSLEEEGPMVTSNAVEPARTLHLTFYPDGSCDPHEVLLAARETSDVRQIAVRIHGLLGRVTREFLEPDADTLGDGNPGAGDSDDLPRSPAGSVGTEPWAETLLGELPPRASQPAGVWAGSPRR